MTEEHRLPPDTDVDAFLATAAGEGKKVVSVAPRREHLEDLFVREVAAAPEGDRS